VVRKVHPLSVIFFALGVVGCVAGIIIAAVGSSGSSPKADIPTVPAGLVASSTGAPSAAAGPKADIPGDGVFIVPAEIKPGTYRAVVPKPNNGAEGLPSCYWARLKDTAGDISSIIANDTAAAGQTLTVTIKPTDKAFQTTGCGPWVKIN
jgi:hypothetical protein